MKKFLITISVIVVVVAVVATIIFGLSYLVVEKEGSNQIEPIYIGPSYISIDHQSNGNWYILSEETEIVTLIHVSNDGKIHVATYSGFQGLCTEHVGERTLLILNEQGFLPIANYRDGAIKILLEPIGECHH